MLNKQLDILFINANSQEISYQELAKQKQTALEPNIWAGMLANSCRNKNFGVSILDCEVDNLSIEKSAQEIININPRIACFVVFGSNPNSSTQSMSGAILTAQKLKNFNNEIKVLFIGNHISALPKETLEEKCIDIICTNEGVYALHNLLKLTDLNDEYLLGKVKGIAWKDKENNLNFNNYEQIVSKEKLEQDLPGIAFDLMPHPSKFKTSPWHSWTNNSMVSPFYSLYTSMGCFATCNFCNINILNRTQFGDNITAADSNIFRHWDPKFIIKSFDWLAEQGVKNIKIADEMFVYKKEHYLELAKLLIERKYNFNIWCYSRVSTIKEGNMDMLREAGIRWLALGIESADLSIRKSATKGLFKDDDIVSVIQKIQKHDIAVGGNYIFGLLNDTRESIQRNIEFMNENLTENMNVYCAFALPGSPLYLEAKKNNWALPKKYSEWAFFSYDTQPLPTFSLSAAEVLKLRDDAWMQYFTNEKYLDWMKSKYGQSCIDSIKAMTAVKLKRKLLGD